ncbi:MAG: hypothetical protein KDD64_05535 [Bdellovibrionales bacterium]|nr:hypothetical protein [Bdellovibrionales bacterium]
MATFQDLRDLQAEKPEAFKRVSRYAMQILSGLNNRDGVFEATRFPQSLPCCEAELRAFVRRDCEFPEAVGSALVENFLFHLSARLDPQLKQVRWPKRLSIEAIEDLDTRVRYEMLCRGGYSAERDLRPSEQAFVFEGDVVAHDYFRATCIRPHEFGKLISRYGKAVILSSLDPSETLAAEIQSGLQRIIQRFRNEPPEKTGRAEIFRSFFPQEFSDIRELLKHFSRAKSLYRRHPMWNFIQKTALQDYLQGNLEQASRYLSDCGLSVSKREEYLKGFERARRAYRGFDSGISRSHFEKEVSKFLQEQGALFREQVSYRTFSSTSRKFVADFVLLGDDNLPAAVIEITSLDDDFIHDEDYATRMSEKEELARTAGLGFYDLCEFDQWKNILLRQLHPADEPVEGVLEVHSRQSLEGFPSFRGRPSRRSVWAFMDEAPRAAYAVLRG